MKVHFVRHHYFSNLYAAKIGHTKIGFVRRVTNTNKWEASTNGVKWLRYNTKKEAVSYLTAPFTNSKIKEQLAWLKEPIQYSDWSAERSDCGTYDVLESFACGLGYVVADQPLKNASYVRSRFNGQIHIREQHIYIKKDKSAVKRADTLAHEIAHHFEIKLLERLPKAKREHLVQAVACAIMRDLGLDTRHFLRQYLNWFTRKTVDFMRGDLDKEFAICYHHFSSELTAFLRSA